MPVPKSGSKSQTPIVNSPFKDHIGPDRVGGDAGLGGKNTGVSVPKV
jgi:hypothetical protein